VAALPPRTRSLFFHGLATVAILWETIQADTQTRSAPGSVLRESRGVMTGRNDVRISHGQTARV